MTSLRNVWVLCLLAAFILAFAVAPAAQAEPTGSMGAWSNPQSFTTSILSGLHDAWSAVLVWTGLDAPDAPPRANRSAVEHGTVDPEFPTSTPLAIPTDGDAGSDQDPHGVP